MEILKQIFAESTSLFNIRFNCLNVTNHDTVDFTTYAGTINKEYEQLKISSIKDEQFRCLIFVCWLKSAGDAGVQIGNLSKIEQYPSTICSRMSAVGES